MITVDDSSILAILPHVSYTSSQSTLVESNAYVSGVTTFLAAILAHLSGLAWTLFRNMAALFTYSAQHWRLVWALSSEMTRLATVAAIHVTVLPTTTSANTRFSSLISFVTSMCLLTD